VFEYGFIIAGCREIGSWSLEFGGLEFRSWNLGIWKLKLFIGLFCKSLA
jgi:hypothetical protein